MDGQLEQRLRDAGYRVTKQRLAVYHYLSNVHTHPNVEEVHSVVRKQFPNVSLATVYKAVDSLVEVGVVRRIHRGLSSARFDASLDDHAHFRCVECDELRDVPMPQNPAGKEYLADCEIIGANVEFFGYCPRCRRRKLGLPPQSSG